MKLTTVIVDDEAPICDEIEYLLGQFNEIEIVGKFGNAFDAIAFIVEHKPRLVFLDIQMPGVSGLEMARKLKNVKQPPLIVMVTAHPEYALECFDTPAVGYVTKPVTAEKLSAVMDKLFSLQQNQPMASTSNKAENKIDVNKICVQTGGKIVPLALAEIVLVGVKDKDVFIRTRTHEYATAFNFQDVAVLLLERSPLRRNFIQVHRQYIVNVDGVTEVIPWFHGTYYLQMDDMKKQQVPVSRNRIRLIKEIMGLK
jgi:two-component system LytT family response regulator/two-component system response regulator LytT